MIGSYNEGDYLKLIHSKYKSSGSHGLREDVFLCFSYCITKGDDDPRGVVNLDPRGMIGRIYVGYHLTLLHTKYTSFRFCGFRDEDFFIFSHYKPMVDNDAPPPPGAWPI